MMADSERLPTCNICSRLHRPEQPCPLRIANAYIMQVGAMGKLTEADKNWMQEHPNFSVLDVIEDAVPELM